MNRNTSHWSFFSSLFSVDKTYIFLKCISQFLSIASEYYVIVVLSFSINEIAFNPNDVDILIKKLVILALLFLIIRYALSVINTNLSAKKIRIIEYDKNRKNSLFSKMPLYKFESEEVQKLITNLKYLEMNGSTSIGKLMDAPILFFSLFLSALLELICIVPIFIGVTIKELIISFFFLLLCVILFLLSSKLRIKYLKKGVESFSNEGKKKLRMIASFIDYQYDVKINPDIRFYNQKLLEEGAAEESEISMEVFSAYWNNVSKGSFFSTFFRTTSFLVSLVFVTYFAVIGKISLGSIVFYSTLLEKIVSHVEKAITQYNVLKAGDEYFERRLRLERITDSEIQSQTDTIDNNWKKIEFRNVSYSYPESKRKILDSINLILYRNDSTAIIGLNGSGKSTLIQLLLKLRKPDEGKILIDEKDIWSLSTKDYMQLMSPMFQDSSLFCFSIRDNLFIKEKTEEKIMKEMGKFNLKEIDLDLIIGENGVGLSGGQEKRVLFLRSLINDNKYMVLDEPTSASDPEGEEAFFEALEEKSGYLIVTHKISKLKGVPRIIVIKEGKIVADGSWNNLSANDGLFKELLECEKRLYDER